jgi:uncharacterized protein YndB with AHSA1/START domain
MTTPSPNGGTSEVGQFVRATRAQVYAACTNPEALAIWRVPNEMTARVDSFDPGEGGRYRMSLTYNLPEDAQSGKTEGATDTFEATFAELVPDERVVELIHFQSPDASYSGEMVMTTTLTEAAGGTEVRVRCENIPPGIRPEDNEEGTRQALEKLAGYVEGDQ